MLTRRPSCLTPWFLGLLALLMIFGSVSAAPAATSPSGNTTFRIVVGIDPDTWDPHGHTTTTVGNLIDYMVEKLVRIDQQGKVHPFLAESWKVSKDGKEYTFQLRKGIKFSDGTPFDATAVKASFERLTDPDLPLPSRAPYMPIKQIVAVDPLTVKFLLASPSGPLLSALSATNAGIVSPATIRKTSPNYKVMTQVIGTGPYIFKEHIRGDHAALTRNPEYWGKKPYYDSVHVRIVPEAATRESLLLAGQADLIILPPVSDIPALQKNPNVKVLLAPSDRLIFVELNTTRAPTNNKKVRQAINYAINKEEIIKNVLLGAADIADSPTDKSLLGYCKTGPYPYDPEKAKALLKEAGITPGTKLNFQAPTGRYVQDFPAAQAIAGFLKEVGLEAQPTTADWPTYTAQYRKPESENMLNMTMLGWAATYPDEAHTMQQFSKDEHPPKGSAPSFYTTPKVEEMIKAALGETDPQKRLDMYCQLNKIVWDDAPWLFLWTQRFPIVYSAKVTNISSDPTEKFDALYAEPAK
jgi:ABC-type transport system substrate-binding protein